MTGDCLSKKFRDVRNTPVKLTEKTKEKYKKMDKHFETLDKISYLQSLTLYSNRRPNLTSYCVCSSKGENDFKDNKTIDSVPPQTK